MLATIWPRSHGQITPPATTAAASLAEALSHGLADNSVGRLIEWLVRVWRCLRWTALSSISQHGIVAACGPA